MEYLTEKEIRETFARMGVKLASKDTFATGFVANSQYGFTLKDGFYTEREAEAYTINYYASRMSLLRQ